MVMIDGITPRPDLPDLKPCPFCGSTATLWTTNDNKHSPFVMCNNDFVCRSSVDCFAQTRPWEYKNVEDCIRAWNRRSGKNDD